MDTNNWPAIRDFLSPELSVKVVSVDAALRKSFYEAWDYVFLGSRRCRIFQFVY